MGVQSHVDEYGCECLCLNTSYSFFFFFPSLHNVVLMSSVSFVQFRFYHCINASRVTDGI